LVNGRPVGALPERDDGLMAIPVPQGMVNIAVDWTTTTDQWVGRWLSGLSLFLLGGLYWLEQTRSRTQ
jgi:hypothetical protein